MVAAAALQPVAHQDPNLPVELEMRRTVVKRMASLLEEKFLKEVSIRYIQNKTPILFVIFLARLLSVL